MKPSRLVLRGLTFYWRTNAAIVLGVAAAVAVLAGALLVGDSVRGSLRDLVLQRLGATDHVVVSTGFFREQLAEDLRSDASFGSMFDGICPIVIAQGVVTNQDGGSRAGQVRVYGVDDRFWRFHGVTALGGPTDRGLQPAQGIPSLSRGDALISPALATELGAGEGSTILVRVQRPSAIPLESIHGRKEDVGRTIRAAVRAVVPREMLGEFSLQPQQGDVRAVFLPLARVQNDLEVGGRVNALLTSARPESAAVAANALKRLIQSKAELEDVGLKLRLLNARQAVTLEADAGLLDDTRVQAAQEAAASLDLRAQPIFTYLATRLSADRREIPYSLVTAIDLRSILPEVQVPPVAERPPIVLNDWAARDLKVGAGDAVVMEYYVWEEPGRLITRTTEFRVAGVIPINAADPDLAPVYPGITESPTLDAWDPPFPVDLRRVRREDEEYWKAYRTTPKAFIPLEVGQRLWRSRYGAMTSIRILPSAGHQPEETRREYAERLRSTIDPLTMGLAVRDVRVESLEASVGATDFGAYFLYFSVFLVVSALLLAALFFKLSVEQRAREVGLLGAVGFRMEQVRRLFVGEALALSLVGGMVGMLGGIGYAYLMMTGLRTWWFDAVGTTALTLHVSWASVMLGAVGGVVAATGCIWWTLRSLASVSTRSLLAGRIAADEFGTRRRAIADRALTIATIALGMLGAALIVATALELVERTGAFFGAGTALLAACLSMCVLLFRRPTRHAVTGHGWWPVSRLGMRNASYRPSRSVLSIAVMASAIFILISVDAFRRDDRTASTDPRSGAGGYSLLVESLLPIVHDPNTKEGRETLGLAELDSVTMEPFRVLPGDDTSCLNLYEPKNPRILAPGDRFIAAGRFAFQASLASNDAERANPWLLLTPAEVDGAVPVIADANSMTYVLHRKIGEEITISRGDRPIRLRLVAALDDSIFQGELLMSQANFLRLFPEQQGYSLLLVETVPAQAAAVAAALEDKLADYGADATSTAERLAQFHKVENTYLSTFQTLGGLGLLLGTVGLGAVLLRNVLERRRELALLRALGYKRAHVVVMIIAENLLLLLSGLVAGTLSALLSIAPVAWERAGRLPVASLALLLGGVLAVGLVASLGATAAALRSPLLPALRAE